MSDSRVNLVSWNRFTTRNFIVVPTLLGLAHEFPFEDGQVRIELPTAGHLPQDITDESILKSFDSILTIVEYKEEDGRKNPTGIRVNSVDVLVYLNKTITLPKEVLTRHPNPYDLLTEKQQKHLDKLAKNHGNIAYGAFDQWIRILRWKSGNGAIGRPEIHGFESGWSTYLLNSDTIKRFWSFREPFALHMYKGVTLEEWHGVEETLKLGQESPVYIDSMFDGIEQFNLGNLQHATVDLAVACEAFMRSRFMQNLPEGLTKAVYKYIDEANIRQVLEHFFKEILSEEQMKLLKRINSDLHLLFDDRNTILHSGHKEDLTSVDCQKYIEVTKKLISIG